MPKTDIALHRYIVSHASFGNTKLTFAPEGKHPLTRINIITLAIACIPVFFAGFSIGLSLSLGQYHPSTNIFFWLIFLSIMLIPLFFFIVRLWYFAALTRYTFDNTTLGTLRFKATHTGWNMLDLFFVNWLIVSITLGLGTAFVIGRRMRYLSNNLFLVGDIDTSGIKQSDEVLGTSGEGLDGMLGDSGLM